MLMVTELVLDSQVKVGSKRLLYKDYIKIIYNY